MHVIDAHCDTLLAMCESKKDMQFTYEKASTLGMHYLQFFALFCPPSLLSVQDGMAKSENHLSRMMSFYETMICEYKYSKVLYKEDITAFDEKKDNAIPSFFSLLSMEGIYLAKNDISYINYLYERGVRCLSFTWNPSNEFAQGINGENSKGLSNLGVKAVLRCNELGILVDVSHANDRTFNDIACISTKPFVATHSNSRYICAHKRNLDNSMLKTIAKANGLTGINYFSDFLIEKEKNAVAGVDDIIRHIEYIAALIGTKHIGLGSDFDGIEKAAIKDVTKVGDIINALLKLNYSEDAVRNICSGNMIRILKEVLNNGEAHSDRI